MCQNVGMSFRVLLGLSLGALLLSSAMACGEPAAEQASGGAEGEWSADVVSKTEIAGPQ